MEYLQKWINLQFKIRPCQLFIWWIIVYISKLQLFIWVILLIKLLHVLWKHFDKERRYRLCTSSFRALLMIPQLSCDYTFRLMNIFYITKDSFWACRSREFFSLIFPPHPLFPGGINQIQTKIWSCQEEIGKETLENQSFPLNSLPKSFKYSY